MSAAVLEQRRAPAAVEYVPAAFLGLLGLVLILDAARIHNPTTGADPLGPRPVPLLVGVLSLALAIALAVAVRRGDRPEAEAGEDIDLSSGTDVKTVVLLVAVFASTIVLIDPLGWVISGGLLFYGSVLALGSRHLVRDLLIAAALALATFYGFAIGLGVNLPAGILQGIL
jgi:putative tricarboxylic transport membrane protein